MDETTTTPVPAPSAGAAPVAAAPAAPAPAVAGGTDAPPAAEAPRDRPPVRKVAVQKPKRPKGVSVSDPVADMLTRIRNGVVARHDSIAIPTSRMKVEVARILKQEGYITGYELQGTQLTVKPKYAGKLAAISGIKRISRPGLRVYGRKDEMPRVLGGLGIAIVSTSSGLMSGREAERKGLGGEILAHVW